MKHLMGALLVSMVVAGTVGAAEAGKEELAQSSAMSSTALSPSTPLHPEGQSQEQTSKKHKKSSKTSRGHNQKRASKKRSGKATTASGHHGGGARSHQTDTSPVAADRQ